MPSQPRPIPAAVGDGEDGTSSFVSALSGSLPDHPAGLLLPLHLPVYSASRLRSQSLLSPRAAAASLVGPYASLDGDPGHGAAHDDGQRQDGAPQLRRHARALGELAGPLFIEGVAAIGEQLVATACVGHLADPAALAALVLAQSLYNVLGYSLVSGLASALETLCGQAYGAGQLRLLPVQLLRAQLVCAVAVLPTTALWGSGALRWLLPALGQDPGIAQPAAQLLRILVPALALTVLSETTAQYLLAQSNILPGCACSVAALLLSPALNWGLVFGAGLGLRGAALAAVAIQALLALLLLGYLAFRDCARPLPGKAGISSAWASLSVADALRGWGSYLALGLPCVLMVCLEWWVWELLIVAAGWLPNAEVSVAAMGLSTQVQLLPWVACYALGTATATRVAQALGAGDARQAAQLVRLALALALSLALLLCGGMFAGRRVIVAALTSSPAVQAQLQELMPLVVAAIVCDGGVAVLGGMLRGAGHQSLGALANWGSYWLAGLPLAWLLGFHLRLGVWGLRLALVLAAGAQAAVLAVFWLRLDWPAEVERAQLRVAAEDGDWLDAVTHSDEDDARREPLLAEAAAGAAERREQLSGPGQGLTQSEVAQ